MILQKTAHAGSSLFYDRLARGLGPSAHLFVRGVFMAINNKMSAIVLGLAAIAGFSLAPSSANAQSADRERGAILLGTFITNRNTDARVDSNSGNPGTDV